MLPELMIKIWYKHGRINVDILEHEHRHFKKLHELYIFLTWGKIPVPDFSQLDTCDPKLYDSWGETIFWIAYRDGLSKYEELR